MRGQDLKHGQIETNELIEAVERDFGKPCATTADRGSDDTSDWLRGCSWAITKLLSLLEAYDNAVLTQYV